MRRSALLAISLSACSLEQNLSLDLPDLSDAQSMIVAVERSGELYVYAEDVSAGRALSIPIALPDDADARIDMLTYPKKLEELDILPGQVLPAESDPMRPLPAPAQHFTTNVERGVAGAAEPGTRGDALAAFRIPGVAPPPPSACFDFSGEPINLVGTREVEGFHGFAIAVSPTRVLVGTENQELFMVAVEGAVPIPVEPANVAITAGAVDERGQLWFGDRDGSLWRGELGNQLVLDRVATSTMGGIHVLDVGAIDGGLTEAFAVTDTGTLMRFDGVGWKGLHSMCRVDLCTEKYGYRLRRLGPGEAVALRFKATKMLHLRGGEAVAVDIPYTTVDEFHARSLEKIEGFGVAVGVEGRLLRFDPADDTWEDAVFLPAFDVYSVIAFELGLVFGGDAGAVTSYIPNEPACPVLLIARSGVLRLMPLGDGLLAIGERTPGGTNAVPLTVLSRL